MADNTFKRYELKYMLDREQYEQIMSEMIRYMQPDRFAHSQIINIYFDTPSHRLIRDSIEKPVYKEKLRLRSYGVPDDDSEVFIELKKKYKSVVYKRRLEVPEQEAMDYLVGGSAAARGLSDRKGDRLLHAGVQGSGACGGSLV